MTGILQPAIRFDDFKRIGRGDQDWCEQRIRKERDRCEQLVQLLGFEKRQSFGFVFGRRCFRCRGWYRGYRGRRGFQFDGACRRRRQRS